MKMKKITEFKNFETFIKEMNENHTQKKSIESIVEVIVKEIKEKYGQTAKEFISTVNEKGVNDLKDFIQKTVKPIDSAETKTLIADYENILSGLVSWVMLEKDK